MSGGSFNYLCFQDANEIISSLTDLRGIAELLQQVAPTSKATLKTVHIVDLIEHVLMVIDGHKILREDVWHDVEWWQDCDISRERLIKTIEEYENK